MKWTALLLGLGGGLHCAGMCGPLVLGLPGPSTPGAARRRVIYQAGRLATYLLLGASAGALGHSLALFGVERWVSLGAGLAIAAGIAWGRFSGGGRWWSLRLARLRQLLLPRLNPGSAVAFATYGALNGLLPCGLVYVACAAAAATGGLWSGANYMLWFGLGTVPILLGISLSHRAMPASLRFRLRSLSPLSVALVAGMLILRGLALGIPYLSPALEAGGACPHCH